MEQHLLLEKAPEACTFFDGCRQRRERASYGYVLCAAILVIMGPYMPTDVVNAFRASRMELRSIISGRPFSFISSKIAAIAEAEQWGLLRRNSLSLRSLAALAAIALSVRYERIRFSLNGLGRNGYGWAWPSNVHTRQKLGSGWQGTFLISTPLL